MWRARPTLALTLALGALAPTACVSGDASSELAAAGVGEARPAKKWHPGHYKLMGFGAPRSRFDDILNEPTVQGVEVRYSWGQLEPARGRYDFSRIDADLATLRPHGKRLVLKVMDRIFHSTNPYQNLPAYIVDDPRYGVTRTRSGFIANVWEEPTMDRLIALYRALAARYDSEPLFEAIMTAESSVGTVPSPPRSARATQINRLVTEAAAAWPHTLVVNSVNWLGDEVPGVIEHTFDAGAAIGGPDVIAGRPTAGQRIVLGAPYSDGPGYQGRMPIMYDVQGPDLGCDGERSTPAETYDFAVEELEVTHLFWIASGTGADTATCKVSWRNGILPEIRARGAEVGTTACPENIDCSRD